MTERAISFLGLAVIMGLGYLFSRHRKSVNFRTVVWGVGLQLTFAVIILGSGNLSFAGMFLLVFLIILYLYPVSVLEGARGARYPPLAHRVRGLRRQRGGGRPVLQVPGRRGAVRGGGR